MKLVRAIVKGLHLALASRRLSESVSLRDWVSFVWDRIRVWDWVSVASAVFCVLLRVVYSPLQVVDKLATKLTGCFRDTLHFLDQLLGRVGEKLWEEISVASKVFRSLARIITQALSVEEKTRSTELKGSSLDRAELYDYLTIEKYTHNDWDDVYSDYSDWTDHDDVAHSDWTDADHSDSHTDWNDHVDTYDDWPDHDDWTDHDDSEHEDWSDHKDVAHDDVSHEDWDDHVDWGDQPHEDSSSHTDWADYYYNDWSDHSDWDDYSDHFDHQDTPHGDTAHEDWSDHVDVAHADWSDSPHGDWDDYSASGYSDHSDYQDSHSDWTDHSDVAHSDWSNGHSDTTHSDHSDSITHKDWSNSYKDYTDHDDTVHEDYYYSDHSDWEDSWLDSYS